MGWACPDKWQQEKRLVRAKQVQGPTSLRGKRDQERGWGQMAGRGKTPRGQLGWLRSWKFLLGGHRQVLSEGEL